MGLLTAVVVWLITLAISIPFVTRTWWMPEAITDLGRLIDDSFMVTLVITGFIFVVAQVALGYTVWRYGQKSEGPADDTHGNNKLEILWTVAAGLIFVGLTLTGYSVWAETRFIKQGSMEPSADRLMVEVTGQQFVWNMRYPGEDNQFGPTDITLIDDAGGNPVGLDRSGPGGAGRHHGAGDEGPGQPRSGSGSEIQGRLAQFLRSGIADQARHCPGPLLARCDSRPTRKASTKSSARNCADWDITRCAVFFMWSVTKSTMPGSRSRRPICSERQRDVDVEDWKA